MGPRGSKGRTGPAVVVGRPGLPGCRARRPIARGCRRRDRADGGPGPTGSTGPARAAGPGGATGPTGPPGRPARQAQQGPRVRSGPAATGGTRPAQPVPWRRPAQPAARDLQAPPARLVRRARLEPPVRQARGSRPAPPARQARPSDHFPAREQLDNIRGKRCGGRRHDRLRNVPCRARTSRWWTASHLSAAREPRLLPPPTRAVQAHGPQRASGRRARRGQYDDGRCVRGLHDLTRGVHAGFSSIGILRALRASGTALLAESPAHAGLLHSVRLPGDRFANAKLTTMSVAARATITRSAAGSIRHG